MADKLVQRRELDVRTADGGAVRARPSIVSSRVRVDTDLAPPRCLLIMIVTIDMALEVRAYSPQLVLSSVLVCLKTGTGTKVHVSYLHLLRGGFIPQALGAGGRVVLPVPGRRQGVP